MKTLLLTIAISLGVLFGQAQVIDTLMVIKKEQEAPAPSQDRDDEVIVRTEKGVDTTVIRFNNKRIVIVDDGEDKQVKWDSEEGDEEGEYDSWEEGDDEIENRNKKSDVGLLALDLGFVNYHAGNTFGADAAPANMAVRPGRFASHVSLHFLPTTVSLLGKGTVNLKTALTFDYTNYFFEEDITLVKDQDVLTVVDAGNSLDKNKLVSRYFQVPMLLNINTDPWGNDGLSISFGVYGGVLWRSHTKQVSDENGKVKEYGDFNLNPIRYGLMARFDLKWMDLYATYNLSEMFAEGQGPSTQVFTVGLNLFDF